MLPIDSPKEVPTKYQNRRQKRRSSSLRNRPTSPVVVDNSDYPSARFSQQATPKPGGCPAGITAYLEEVSTPNFTGTTPDNMGFRMPVKIKLANPLLGNNCYIGSDSNPVILHSTVDTLAAPQAIPTGEPGQLYENITASDDNFAVPAATGCGPFGSLNWAVDARAGLPSGSGSNVLNITADLFTGVPYSIWLYRQSQ